MKRTTATNVRADVDSTGSIISIDWVCPYCEFENHELVNTTEEVSEYGFEMDRECGWCLKTVTVECPDVEMGL